MTPEMNRDQFRDLVESIGGVVSFETKKIGGRGYPIVSVILGRHFCDFHAPTYRDAIKRAVTWVEEVARKLER